MASQRSIEVAPHVWLPLGFRAHLLADGSPLRLVDGETFDRIKKKHGGTVIMLTDDTSWAGIPGCKEPAPESAARTPPLPVPSAFAPNRWEFQ